MIVKVKFVEEDATFKADFGEVFNVSDGGYEKGYAEGYEKGYDEAKAEDETFFTRHGTMYKKHMVIDSEGTDGFNNYAYRYADKMETLSVPYQKSLWTAAGYIFNGCTALKTASLPNIQRIGARFFWECTSLETVTLGTPENPMVEIATNSFQNCPALVHFNYIGVIAVNADFSESTKLSHDSLITILNSLSSGTAGTLTLGATNLAKLADEEKAIATNKGWKLQ